MDNSLILIFIGLANFRISKLLKDENGLLGIFVRLRMLVGIEYFHNSEKIESVEEYLNIEELDGEIIQEANSETAKLFSCLWCLSLWVGMLLAIFFAIDIKGFLLITLSSSTIAMIVDKGFE